MVRVAVGMIDPVAVFIHFHFHVIMVVIMMMVMMLMLVILIIVVMMVVVMLVFILLIIVVMMVVMMLMFILLIIVVMMVVVMLVFILLIIVVMMVVMMPMFIFVIIVVMMVMMLVFILLIFFMRGNDLCQDLSLQVGSSLDGLQNSLSVKLGQRRCNDRRLGVMGPEQFHHFRSLRVAGLISPCQDDSTGVLDLVNKELTKVLDIQFGLGSVYDRDSAVQYHIRVFCYTIDSGHDFGELADTGGLDQDALRRIGIHDFPERGAEITYQRAADTAGIHFTDLNPGLFQKASVDADLTEFVLDQNYFGARQGVSEELFDQGCLSGSQKTGYNVNFCHFCNSS